MHTTAQRAFFFDILSYIDYDLCMHSKVSTKIACTNCFKSLGIPSRMEIYVFLDKNGSSTVSKIVEAIKLKQPTISYHLKEMEQDGMLDSKKVGKEVHYSLSKLCRILSKECVLTDIKFINNHA